MMMTNKTPYRMNLRSRTFAFDGHLPGGAWPCFISKGHCFVKIQVLRQLQLFDHQWIARRLASVFFLPSARDSADDSPSFSELRNRWVGVKACKNMYCKTWNKNVRIHMNSHHRRRYESSINWDADYSELHGNPTVAENDNEVIKRKSGGHE